MAKWTPGPWHIGTSLERHRANIWSQTEAVTSVPYSSDTEQANAQLIAAAPELLEALGKALLRCEDCATCGPDIDCPQCAEAWDILRRAKGEDNG